MHGVLTDALKKKKKKKAKKITKLQRFWVARIIICITCMWSLSIDFSCFLCKVRMRIENKINSEYKEYYLIKAAAHAWGEVGECGQIKKYKNSKAQDWSKRILIISNYALEIPLYVMKKV